MAKEDYERFLYKIDQLNQFVELIKNSPEKYQLIINCKTHDDVVSLARCDFVVISLANMHD